MSQALCFNEVTLSPVSHQNNIWIRAVELARALGYADESSVGRIYQRNADEFTPDMTQIIEISDTVNLTVPARIFSLRGCHLLAMFARTPVAKKFRRWVLDVLDKLAMEERARAATDDKALPEVAITPEQQAQLKAIADAKIGMIAPELQRKAYGELWSRFTRHFRIARYAQLPSPKMGEAVEYLVGLEIKALKTLPPAPEQKALPAVPSPSASFLSAADIAALEAAGQRVIALSAYVHREIHELHVEILNVLDIRRMPAGRWRAMSSHIWYSLLDAVNIAPESLTRDTVTGREYRNPAYWTLEMLKDMPAA